MNFYAMISDMEAKIESLKKDLDNYNDEKVLLERRLAEVNSLLSPIATDIEGLEMAIESLKSTSLISAEPNEVIAEEPVVKEDEESLQKRPARRGGKRRAIHINVYDQYGMLKKRFGSIKEAKVGLRWGHQKIMDSLLMDKAVQLSRYGFYISQI